MRLAEQWREIQGRLPGAWGDARVSLTVTDPAHAGRAAALLGPLTPSRRGNTFRFVVARHGTVGLSPGAAARVLERLDDERIDSELELLASSEAVVSAPASSRPSLAESWEAQLAGLPPDWSDVYAELELTSTDYLERAALLTAPLNPAHSAGPAVLRFRSASHFGYGAPAVMVRRCLERLDDDGITGEVRILRALSDTRPVGTQGPVWYVGGKAV